MIQRWGWSMGIRKIITNEDHLRNLSSPILFKMSPRDQNTALFQTTEILSEMVLNSALCWYKLSYSSRQKVYHWHCISLSADFWVYNAFHILAACILNLMHKAFTKFNNTNLITYIIYIYGFFFVFFLLDIHSDI